MSRTMRSFASKTTSDLLDQVIYNLANAVRSHDEDSVHKLRVSIRRLQQALRLFDQYLNSRGTDRVKEQLRAVLKGAAEVRNRDIALKLVRSHGADGGVATRLEQDRREQARSFSALLKRESRKSGKWRARLGLD